MIKSIKFKIWFTFVATLVVSLAAMVALTYISLQRSFLEYTSQQAVDRLQFLEAAVIEIYERDGSLATLNKNNRLWKRLTYLTFREYLYQREQRALSKNQALPPGNQVAERKFIEQLILTDTNKDLIVGLPSRNREYSWRRLTADDNTLALIGYVRPNDFIRPVDRLFLNKQQQAFAILGTVIFFASFGIALMVSRWLTQPLDELSKGAKTLMRGDFSVRITRDKTDELGQLCNNFNELAKTLSANENARKQWVADISHEMRTPLSVIKAQIEAMQDGIRPATPKNLGLLKSKIDSLNSLINDLYELSLSDLGALTYTKESVDISALIDEIAADYKLRADTMNIVLNLNNTLGAKNVLLCDTNRIRQLLRNLLENSMRYTDAPGVIQIKTYQHKASICIDVQDSSPGVPAAELAKIFERLYRVEASRNRATGGAGLGLSICKNIVEAHRGAINAEASPLGGLAISIKLPTGG
ncbi:MAG: HAMP domain-containing protein [Cellvibrionaceae bacterium]|nr:HAMP domain-containing protein [Cellvibrionaceae bacterium]